MSGRESKKVGGQCPRGDRMGGSRGPVCREVTFQGQSLREGERLHPEEAASSCTHHAPSAAAAPAPGACASTVTERIKAQDPPDAVSNQHHLGERAAPQGGWQVVGGPHNKLLGVP